MITIRDQKANEYELAGNGEHTKTDAFKAGFDARGMIENEAIGVALSDLEFYGSGYAEFTKDKGERAKTSILRIKTILGLPVE